MTFVILQPCCNDASCADVCPVDCIHPTPDEPGYMQAEMLHIDPGSCIDCGACVDECPVDAIRADHELTAEQSRYLHLNATYFEERHDPADNHRRRAEGRRETNAPDVRIAIVGTGPAAFYAASELAGVRGIEVEMYDRLVTPYGLVRAGVAPDHPETKIIAELFRAVAGRNSVRVHLGVEIGTDLSHEDLLAHHDAVIYATGASDDRRLGIDGEDLPGSHAANEFVAWYNGHPDYAAKTFDLSCDRAVVIGNGNVALDLARILTASPDDLARTDIADHALIALRASAVREVVVVGRRGPAQTKFTTPELAALVDAPHIDLVVQGISKSRSSLEWDAVDPVQAAKMDLIYEIASRSPTDTGGAHRRIVLRFCASPISIEGDRSVSAIELADNSLSCDSDGHVRADPSGSTVTVPTGLVLRSVGYRGHRIPGVPFDDERGVVPNIDGRVIDTSGCVVPGVYVVGWIKRGPTGVIGTNKKCAIDTVENLLSDIRNGRLSIGSHGSDDVDSLVRSRVPDALSFPDWTSIDRAETDAGSSVGRPRVKMVSSQQMRSTVDYESDPAD